MIANPTYSTLVNELKRVYRLANIVSLMEWDEQVNLPSGSAASRADEASTYADLLHRENTNPKIGDWLSQLESVSDRLSDDQKVVIREARRWYDRLVKLPSDFVSRRTRAHSQAFHAWKDARSASNFAKFAPFLQINLDLAREEASYHGKSGDTAYDFHLDSFDPGMTARVIEALFDPLEKELVPLVRQILDSPVKPEADLLKGFPEDNQEHFLRQVMTAIGFDFTRGRLDRSVHPFCGGTPTDVRMTTRYNPDDPLDSLSGAMHETGHALYEQGLPIEHLGTGLGSYVGMAVHESQSRLWENQVGRSHAFWHYWEPKFRKTFPGQTDGISSERLYMAINGVRLSPIRVDSDEVTYNLHILLRFEIEKRLFRGQIDLHQLPETWNTLSERILGYRPKNDREGCLQDIHWSAGMFGYFPSYCLGNMLAAQLWYAVHNDIPDLAEMFAQGDYQPLLAWLRANIHCQGKRYNTLELTKRVTGQDLGHTALLRYLRERYLPLYVV